jgi:hypothetical protein
MKFKLRLMLVAFIVIATFTGCNGKSFNGNMGVMPISMDNIKLYFQKQHEVSKSVALGGSKMDKIIKIYKTPLDEMGYNFDATILATTKVLRKAPYNQLSVAAHNILNDVMQYVKMYPQESVDKGFVKVKTRDKILTYLKYSEFNENVIQALNYVRQCQQSNNGICRVKQYVNILLDNKFLVPSQNQTLTPYHLLNMFCGKIKSESEFEKYIEDKNGDIINVNSLFLTEDYKAFRLKDNVQNIIDSYDPWWEQ